MTLSPIWIIGLAGAMVPAIAISDATNFETSSDSLQTSLVAGVISNQKKLSRSSVKYSEQGIIISNAVWKGKLSEIQPLNGTIIGKSVTFQYSFHSSKKYDDGNYLLLLRKLNSGTKTEYFAQRIFAVKNRDKACISSGALDYHDIQVTAKHWNETKNDEDVTCFDLGSV